MSKNIIELSEEIAREAHAGQFRRDKITPYVSHPLAVRDIAREYINYPNNFKGTHPFNGSAPFPSENWPVYLYIIVSVVSSGHDIFEDALDKGFTLDYVMERLIRNFHTEYPKEFFDYIRKAFESVTHNDPNESYLDYILRAKKNPVGRIVKISDISHNLSTLDAKKDKHKIRAYQMARWILLN